MPSRLPVGILSDTGEFFFKVGICDLPRKSRIGSHLSDVATSYTIEDHGSQPRALVVTQGNVPKNLEEVGFVIPGTEIPGIRFEVTHGHFDRLDIRFL